MYPFLKTFFWIYFHIFFRVKINGIENIPKEGSSIICSNHLSLYDPLVIGSMVNRKIYFMAKKELFETAFTKWFFETVGAYPVDRTGTDMSAFKTTVKYLKEGKAVGIFAQGKRMKSGDVDTAKSGAALFSLKGNAKIVPVGISSSYQLFSKIYINFGEPLDFTEFKEKKINTENLSIITDIIMSKINSLMKE